MDLDTIQKLANITTPLILPIIGWGVFVLRDVRDALVKLGEWRTAHEKQDDERHARLDLDVRQLRDRQNGMRNNLFGS